jgi:hypothetical protein
MSDQNNGREEQRTRSFNPNEHVMQLKSKDGLKDYLPVQWRLVWFRDQCPQGTIETEELEYDLDREIEAEVLVWNAEKRRNEKVIKKAKGYARYRAVVTDGKGGRATGTKSESAVNFADFGEKSETGAIGRALAALGYGTQFAPELNEEHRIVDSPVERSSGPSENNGAYSSGSTNNGGESKPIVAVRPTAANGKARGDSTDGADSTPEATTDISAMPLTDQQRSSIRKLCQHLGKAEPEQLESMSYGSAKELIAVLSQEYRQSRSKAS